MKDKKVYKNDKCTDCGKHKNDVKMRSCGYDSEIAEKTTMHRVCNSCEREHLMDI